MEPRQALWMPRGSVRALIALLLVIATIVGALSLLAAHVDQVPGPLATLMTLTGIVVNSYFESKRTNPSG